MIQNPKLIRFESQIDSLSVLDEISDSELAIVEVWINHDGYVPSHNLYIPLEAIKKSYKTLYGKFLVGAFNNWNDFGGHDVTGNPKQGQQIVGYFPDNADLQIKEKDGKNFLVGKAVVSKVYAEWAYELIKKDGGKSVSMEIKAVDFDKNEDGSTTVNAYVYTGVTILGDKINPACKGAEVSIIRFSEKELSNRYETYKLENAYPKLDFSIPAKVIENAKSGLAIRKQQNGSGTMLAFNTGNYLVSHTKANKEIIENIYRRFNSKSEASRLMFGGREGYDWAKQLYEQIHSVTFGIEENQKGVLSMSEEEKMKLEEEKKLAEQTPANNTDIKAEEKTEAEHREEHMADDGNPENKDNPEAREGKGNSDDRRPDKDPDDVDDIDDETDDDDDDEDFAVKCAKLQEEIADLKNKEVIYMKELEDLRNFKCAFDKQILSEKVDSVLAEVKCVFSEEEIANFKLCVDERGGFDAWANSVKAEAFAKSKTQGSKPAEKWTKFAIPDLTPNNESENGGIWGKVKQYIKD